MKKAEIILGIIAIAGIIMRLMAIPGGVILTLISLTVLSTLYYFLSFALLNGIRLRKIFKKESYAEINAQKIIAAILAGFSLSILTMGILFKIQSYPGANLMLIIGLVYIAIVALLSVTYYLRKKSALTKRVLYRSLVIGGLSLLIFVMLPY